MLALQPEPIRKQILAELTDKQHEDLLHDWLFWGRPLQHAPAGDWDGWLMLAGRGGGKTRAGAEWIRREVTAKRASRIALIAETAADGRDVLVEGESGLLNVFPPSLKPTYEPSKRRVTFHTGAIATLYDATEPDQLRGPQHDAAWCDELAKYRYAEDLWSNLLLGLRLGDHPRWMATTTPRPIKIIREMVKDPHVVVTRFSSMENIKNLAPSFQRNVIERYQGTRIGRQEIDAEILDDIPGALWTRRNLDEHRCKAAEVRPLERLVVAIDPAVTSGDSSAETGIIVGGIDGDGLGYVLADRSVRGSPDEWGRAAVAAYRQYEADRIVAECNQGGDMVSNLIRTMAPDVPVSLVRATRGKYVRAEPISALYEQGRIRHVGAFAELEDQMVSFTPEHAAQDSGELKDRVDALVWCMASLFDAMVNHRDWREDMAEPNYGPSSVGGY